MNSHKAIQEELASLNSTLPPVKKPVFTVPDGYFENFSTSVLLKVQELEAHSVASELANLSTLLPGLSKEMPYSVPENYFSSLANEIPVLIGNDPLPSILQETGARTPYQVPDGYFEQLPGAIISKVHPSGAKVVAMGSTRWMRYAAAAIVIGILVLGSILYFRKSDVSDPASGPQNWVAEKLKSVSDKDLEEFVQAADLPKAGSGGTAKRTVEVRNMLTDVTDGELDDFLAAVPTDDDELILIN
ncbi:MAG TPA: hypothetical protein VM843_02690 [Flavisolibacter sp.]|nr:hypothetical protein [Flavisolibacter sp.]